MRRHAMVVLNIYAAMLCDVAFAPSFPPSCKQVWRGGLHSVREVLGLRKTTVDGKPNHNLNRREQKDITVLTEKYAKKKSLTHTAKQMNWGEKRMGSPKIYYLLFITKTMGEKHCCWTIQSIAIYSTVPSVAQNFKMHERLNWGPTKGLTE